MCSLHLKPSCVDNLVSWSQDKVQVAYTICCNRESDLQLIQPLWHCDPLQDVQYAMSPWALQLRQWQMHKSVGSSALQHLAVPSCCTQALESAGEVLALVPPGVAARAIRHHSSQARACGVVNQD
jgi:hypothetical protein